MIIQTNTYNTIFHGPMNDAIKHLFDHSVSKRKKMNHEQVFHLFHDENRSDLYYTIEIRCYGNHFTLILKFVAEFENEYSEISQHPTLGMLINLNNDVEFFGRLTQESMEISSAIYAQFVKMNVG
jgi:hypothetical protein